MFLGSPPSFFFSEFRALAPDRGQWKAWQCVCVHVFSMLCQEQRWDRKSSLLFSAPKSFHTDCSVARDITDGVSALKEFRHRDSGPGRSGESRVS